MLKEKKNIFKSERAATYHTMWGLFMYADPGKGYKKSKAKTYV